MTPKILDVAIVEKYTIQLHYETGEVKLFDVLPYISGPWFKELEHEQYFNTIHIGANGNGIEWEHGQDIAPHELYELGVAVQDRGITQESGERV